ncbi:MAG: cobalt-zinc-cadmium efflux system membrane fusion protein [Phycisphaerales bacterium]|jgi:cobalt-zinc-cadmium efflux system membrane fusion protein
MKITLSLAIVASTLTWLSAAAVARQAQPLPVSPASSSEECLHDIPRSRCPFCTPGLIASLGMCVEHAVPEALCVTCRPFLQSAFVAEGDWCAEHATPESQCVVCTPSAVPNTTAGSLRRSLELPSVSCSTANTAVVLSSPAVARTAGLEFAEVRVGELSRSIERNAEVAYNANRYARLSSRAPGVIAEVLKDLGDRVRAGEVVAVVESMALGSAKADLLQSEELLSLWQANAERERTLMNKGASTERAVLEAQTRLAESRIAVSRARQQLRNLGLTDEELARVVDDGDTGSRLRITAPFDGTLVERSAVMGEVVDESDRLFAVSDTGSVWAMIDLTEADLGAVREGQRVQFRADGLQERAFPGVLTWISTQLDRKTRTIRARAELDNGEGTLRAFMFGRATVRAGADGRAVTVPKSAVQWEGCCNVAFVRVNDEGTVFQPARLTLGFDTGDRYEVLSGLSGGERVVTKGSYILKNEILKDAVGAGCCEVDQLSE